MYFSKIKAVKNIRVNINKQFLCFVLIVFILKTYAINIKYIDSVENVYRTTSNIKQKLNCLYILTFEKGLYNPREGLKHGNLLLSISKNNNDSLFIYNAYNGISNCYETMMMYDSALFYNELAYDLVKKSNKAKILFVSFCNFGYYHKKLGHYNLALQNYLKASKYVLKISDHNPRYYYYIGELYLRVNNFKKAKEILFKGLDVASKRIEDKEYLKNILYGYLGTCYEKLNNQDSAFYFLHKSSKGLTLNNTDTISLANAITFMADAFLTFKKHDSAIFYYSKSQILYNKLKNIPLENLINLKISYVKSLTKKSFPKTISNEVTSIIKNFTPYNSNHDLLLDAYSIANKTYENLNEYKLALYYTRKTDSLSQKVLNREKQLIFLDFEKSYATLVKENRINELTKWNQINKLELLNKTAKINRFILIFILTAISFIIIIFSVVYYNKKRRIFLDTLHKLNLQNLKQKERMRISKDLHDDIGSGLNKILFLGEKISKQNVTQEESKQLIDKIKIKSKQLIFDMRDIIWVLDEDNLQIEALIAKIREYSYDFFEEKNILLNFISSIDENQNVKSIQIVRTIISIIKEILNNILKHSNASKVTIDFQKNGNVFSFIITDNGIGFNENIKHGNGLKNMKLRAIDINADLKIESKLNLGTRTTFIINLNK